MNHPAAARTPLPDYIDSSMIVASRACLRKFYWEYVLNLRPRGRQLDLVAGGAFAAGLEAAYVEYYTGDRDHYLEAAYLAFATAWGDFAGDIYPDDVPAAKRTAKTFSRMFQAIIEYFERYPIATDHVRPMLRQDGKPTLEFSFTLPLVDPMFPRHPSGSPFIYCGRFDAFGHTDGALVIRDEKTTGRAFTRYWAEQWDLRNQFMGYVWSARQLGYPVVGAVVRGIYIQKTQYQLLESPIKIYPDYMLDRFAAQLARSLHRIIDCWNTDYFDYDFGDACTAFGRTCAFHPLCTELTASVWFNEYSREKWNPLTRSTTAIEE